LLVYVLLVCAWPGWPISLLYHMFECITVISYITAFVVIASTLDWELLIYLPFFDDVKRGKMSMTQVLTGLPSSSWPLTPASFFCVTCINFDFVHSGSSLSCPANDLWSFGLPSSKRGKLLTQLIHKALMMTIQMA